MEGGGGDKDISLEVPAYWTPSEGKQVGFFFIFISVSMAVAA